MKVSWDDSSWDDSSQQYMEKLKMFQTTNQIYIYIRIYIYMYVIYIYTHMIWGVLKLGDPQNHRFQL